MRENHATCVRVGNPVGLLVQYRSDDDNRYLLLTQQCDKNISAMWIEIGINPDIYRINQRLDLNESMNPG